ncbi:MAG TPA: MmcQ/YjbR family DNA-binding protein [Micromonosporaceae bacterium]
MATWDDVSRIVLDLPETIEQSGRDGMLAWRVRNKPLAWERPLRRSDLEALGDAAPDGPILAARVPDLGAKEALLADDPAVYFTTPHFNGYPAILVRLERISVSELEELLVEAWLAQVPKRMARQYLEESPHRRRPRPGAP